MANRFLQSRPRRPLFRSAFIVNAKGAISRFAFVCIMVLYCSLLTGCLVSDEPIFTQADANNVLGVAGVWEGPAPKDNLRVYVRKTSLGSYAVASGEPSQDLKDAGPWPGVVAVYLQGGYYAVQISDNKQYYIFLMQISQHFLVVYQPNDNESKSAAKKVHMPLEGSAKIPHGVGKAKIKEYFLALADMADSLEKLPKIYQRKGGFVDEAGKGYDLHTADAAYDAKSYYTALSVYQYLADRGNADAQLKVAQIRGETVFDSDGAIQAAQEAYASGNREAAFKLAHLYGMGTGDPGVPRGVQKNPDYMQAILWAATSIMANSEIQEAAKYMTIWSRKACALPEFKSKQPDAAECSKGLTTYALDIAKTKAEITMSRNSIIQKSISLAEIRAAVEEAGLEANRLREKLGRAKQRQRELEEIKEILSNLIPMCQMLPAEDPLRSQEPCKSALNMAEPVRKTVQASGVGLAHQKISEVGFECTCGSHYPRDEAVANAIYHAKVLVCSYGSDQEYQEFSYWHKAPPKELQIWIEEDSKWAGIYGMGGVEKCPVDSNEAASLERKFKDEYKRVIGGG